MKALGIAMVLIGCTLAGFYIDDKRRRRLKNLEHFIYLFELLNSELRYHLTPLGEALFEVSKRASGGEKRVFLSFKRQLDAKTNNHIESMWQAAIEENKPYLYLKQEDYGVLENFGTACGYLDGEMQRKNIEWTLKSLGECVKVSKEEYNRTSKMTKSLGFLIGASICILLI